jgi:hypothetical protein
MQKRLPILLLGVFFLLLITFAAASAGTLELTLERKRTPNQADIATLAALMLNGTRLANRATEIAILPTPTSEFATVQGEICYPSGQIPAMTAYFMNTTLRKQFELTIYENQNSYTLQLPPGQYYAWAVAPQYQIGGYYSEYVACGMIETCTNHSQKLFEVQAGAAVQGIDICDWPHPLPTGTEPFPR